MSASASPSAGPPSREPAPAGSCDPLTHVRLIWIEGRLEQWIRFGKVAGERIIDRRRRVVSFRAGDIFAFVRWRSNGFGTAQSRLDIVVPVMAGMAYSTVPGVDQGGEILLRLSGWPKVERALQAIDAVEACAVDPIDAAPDHWRHIHNRLTAGMVPRPYSAERHRAWLLRRELQL